VIKTRNQKYYLACAVALAAFIVYLPTLRNEFVEWDDSSYIVNNPNIRSLTPAFFKWAFFQFHSSNWHPLAWISHAIDYQAWGLNPAGHHLTSIVIHAINTYVVVLLVFMILGVSSKSVHRENGSFLLPVQDIRITAVITGLLFGLHPIHVESVAWVSERKDLLCAFFFLLSISSYIQYAKQVPDGSVQENKLHRIFNRRYLLSFLFFIIALLSKPMAVTLPVVLLILDWYPLERFKPQAFKSLLIEKTPFIVCSLFSAVLTILAQRAGGAIAPIEEFPLRVRVLVGVKALVVYLWKMLYPLTLIPFYPYPQTAQLFSFSYFPAVVFVIVISAACLFYRKRKVWLSAWAYYVVTLIPVLGIVQVGSQSMADRYTYLPSLGIFLILAAGVARLAAKLREKSGFGASIVTGGLVLILSLCMSYLTIKQIGIWKNSYVFWNYVIEKEPERVPQAYYSLGTVFLERGDPNTAMAYYDKALTLYPKYVEAYENRGYVLEKMGRFREAAIDYSRSIDLKPSRYQAYYNRAGDFSKMGLNENALADYNKVIDLDPSNYDAYNNRGTVFYQMGHPDKALSDYNQAIALDPERYEAFYNRGALFENSGQLQKALNDYDRAISLNSSGDALLLKEGALCIRAGLFDKALEYLNKYIEKNPNNAEAYLERGLAFALLGQNDNALNDFNKNIALDRDSPLAYFDRGNVYLKMGQRKLAMSDYYKACLLGYKDGCDALRK
jgi:protein O-mannosyl-transferase